MTDKDLCYHRHRTAGMEYGGSLVMSPYFIRCDDCGMTVHWGINNSAPDMPPLPLHASSDNSNEFACVNCGYVREEHFSGGTKDVGERNPHSATLCPNPSEWKGKKSG